MDDSESFQENSVSAKRDIFPKWKESYVNFGDYISKKITKKRRKEMSTITISRCLLPTFGLHPYILFLFL